MDNFIYYLHSEVNEDYVSNPYPKINEQIVIRLRAKNTDDIKKVLLRVLFDGTCHFIEMHCASKKNGFRFYETQVILTQTTINYHFVIITSDHVYYHNRLETVLYPPTEDFDFVINAGFNNPQWVCESVFYQIFPDRFKKGNKEIAVKDNEYRFDGWPSKALQWDNPPPSYGEGHCLDFYGGDLYGIKDAISYFKEIGINALYVNPVFSAKTHHRYDCVDYFSVDEHLGGNEALAQLTEELHTNGIKIIIDVSINHTGIDHPWVKKAIEDPKSDERSFYYFTNGNLKKWQGVSTLPQLNYNSEKLRQLIYKSEESFTKKFLKPPYKIDGYRYDVGNNTGRNGLDQLSNEIFREVRQSVKSVNPQSYICGEHWKDNISYLTGDQWDGAMNYFASTRPARSFAGENDRYLRGMLGKDGSYFVSGGFELKKQIEQHYARIPNQLTFLQFNLLDSHDLHRFHTNTAVFDFQIYKGILILLFLLPGTFSIYYGDEIGLQGYCDTVENARFPMQWDRTQWNMDFLNLYKTLIQIKKESIALHNGSMRIMYADENTFVITRFIKKELIIGVIYKGTAGKTLSIPLIVAGIENEAIQFTDIFSGLIINSNGILDITLNPKESLLLRTPLLINH